MNEHVAFDASPDQDDIRDGLQREMTRRWVGVAREVKRAILMHDALGIGDKAPHLAMPTGDKAEMFRRWLNERLSVGVGGYDGSWLGPFVRRASERGAGAALADAQVNVGFLLPSGPSPSAKACHGATVASLAGICEDVSAKAHDSVARGLLLAARPRKIARLVDQAMGHGLRRSRALAEHAVTQAYSQGTLDAMEARGVTHVGTVSERKRRRLRDAEEDDEVIVEGQDGALFRVVRHGDGWAVIALDFDPDEPRNPLGEWTAGADYNEDVLPPAPGTGPIPEGSVRLYHQTSRENALKIAREGIKLSEAKGYEGPKAIYADEHGFYGDPKKFPHGLATVEFHVPRKEWDAPFVKSDKVDPSQIVAVHLPEHGHIRYAVGDPDVRKAILHGEHDDLLSDPDYGPAIKYVKAHFKDAWLEDAPRKTPQPKHPRSGKFAKAHVVAREMRRSKRTGQFRRQGVSPEEQRREELREARFGRVKGRFDVLTAGDDRVCDVCDEISADGPYTINKARSLIPAHPNCRCVFVAAGSMQDAFDPDEPRDERGRWSESGGAVREGWEAQPPPDWRRDPKTGETIYPMEGRFMKAAWIEQKVKTAVAEAGYDPDKVFLAANPRAFNVGDKTYTMAGEAYVTGDGVDGDGHMRHKGDIVIYGQPEKGFREDFPVRGTAVHEAMHQKWQAVLDYVNKAPVGDMSQDPIKARVNQYLNSSVLETEDGVTEYSKSYWDAYKHPFDPKRPSYGTAIHETLAEIARLDDEESGFLVKPVWRHFYNAVNEAWDMIKPKQAHAAPH